MVTLRRIPRSLLGAVAVLTLGLLADFAFTTPQAERFRALEGQRNQVSAEFRTLQARDADLRELARSLGYHTMWGALDSLATEDPVTFITGAVEAARLSRGELATRATKDEGALRRTQFFLVVRGPYDRISRFLVELEAGARLTTIDGLVLSPLGSNAPVEARINLSIYDPRRNADNGS